MPQTVEIIGGGTVEFPDDMTPDEIKGVLKSKPPTFQTLAPKTGEVAPPVIAESVPERPSAVAQEAGQAGIEATPFVRGAAKSLSHLIPQSFEDVKTMTTLPRAGNFETEQLPQSEELGAAWRGERGAEAQGEAIMGTALQALPLSGLLFGKSPLRPSPRDLALVEQLRKSPSVPEGGTATTAPTLSETLFGKQEAPLVEEVNQSLADLESRYGTQPTGVAPAKPYFSSRENELASHLRSGQITRAQYDSEISKLKGEPNASEITSTTRPTQPKVRTPVGEDPSLRQQRPAAQAREGIEEGAQAAQDAVAPVSDLGKPEAVVAPEAVGTGGGLPEGWIEEGLHSEYPDIGAKVDRYVMNNDASGIFSALKDPRYPEYQQDLQLTLRKVYGDEIPVSRISGYGTGGTGQSGGLAYVSVSTNPKWGEAAAKQGHEIWRGTVKPEDVILGGHEAEGELIVKKSGIKTEPNALRTVPSRETVETPPVPETPASTTASGIQKESVAAEPVTPEPPPISTKNEYTEAQRSIRGMPEAEQAAKRGFGKVWDEASAESRKDPTIGRRLVTEINAKPRPISDLENAHLLRREIEAQKEHTDAVDAVNIAETDSDLTAAKARLESARNDLQEVYDATKSAGTKGGQALAARQMLAKEDYSLAKMEARRRAANNGEPLNETQLSEIKSLNDKIEDLQSKLDAHEVATRFENEFKKLVDQSRKEARVSKSSGTRFTDFMDRKANEARSRITDRRGKLTTGFDPIAITDEAIIGASHIAKGVTKFADWSVKMAEEFGEQIRPFLKELWERSKAFHDANAKEYGDKALARYKTYLGKQTEQIKGKLESGDFTKAQRQKTQLDKEAFNMRADLQKLKNQFERGVAKEAYKNKSPAQKFWDHFVGVERGMKLSGPEVFGKLGVAAAVREVLAPIEAAGGYGVSKVFPKFAKGTRYEADLGTVARSELKAKAALFTEGMKDAWQNVKGGETGLEAIGDKYGRRPEFWYNRIGKMHAAIKAPVKRAEFVRSLEQKMSVAIKNGEDINHPEVMTRLANEAVMDANRAIFQEKTVVSSFFSTLDRQSPAAGRVARFLFPVVKIPVNLFKELVNLHVGAPVGAAKIGMAYWKGVETLPALQREAIIRQLTKGSIGGAGLLWGYYNSDKVRNFLDHAPTWFNHTPMAMILNEGSYLKKLEQGKEQAKEGKEGLIHMAKTDIPFMYTIKDIGDALDTHNSHALLGWINNMTQSTVVPQISTQVAKQMDRPGTFPSNLGEKPAYRPATNPLQAVKLGIPGLRQTVPVKEQKKHSGTTRRR